MFALLKALDLKKYVNKSMFNAMYGSRKTISNTDAMSHKQATYSLTDISI